MVRAILAPNPSPMTFTGTQSYLLGRHEVVLIDPGPDSEAHARAILAALSPGERIVAILLSHSHADHVAGLARMQDLTGAESLGFGPSGAGRSARMQALVAQGLPDRGEGHWPSYAPDRRLTDGEVIAPAGVAIEVLHTPGHTGCSLSFAVGDMLFTGDLVMGWASSLVAPPDGDVGDYLASLDRLSARPWRRLYPGHGDPVTDPAGRLSDLARHRRAREAQVLAALQRGPATVPDLTRAIYTDTPPALLPAAAENVLAHLIDLCFRARVTATPAPLPQARFALA
jgi:hydroxyacylglutathione hydrolase